MYHGANKSAIATLKALGSDPNYVELCNRGKRFMARLTPKIEPERALKYFEEVKNYGSPEIAVCRYLKRVGRENTARPLKSTLNTHDFLTQSCCSKFELK